MGQVYGWHALIACSYVLNAKKTIEEALDVMPSEGRFELYPFYRKLIHKFGFRCWAGEEGAHQHLGKVSTLLL